MRISVNTETEELEELRHAVAIIEDAIKRRENPDLYEEDYKQEAEEKSEKKEAKSEQVTARLQQEPLQVQQKQIQQQAEPIKNDEQQAGSLAVEKPTVSNISVEAPKPQIGLNLTKPMSYSQIEQVQQVQKPKPMPSRREERGTAAAVDISALSMSSYGEAKEGRKMEGLARSSNSSSSSTSSFSGMSSTTQSSSRFEPRGFEPRGFESRSSESAVKDIITSLRNQRAGQPIQMSEIVSKARTRNISEQETRNLVSKLQREGTI